MAVENILQQEGSSSLSSDVFSRASFYPLAEVINSNQDKATSRTQLGERAHSVNADRMKGVLRGKQFELVGSSLGPLKLAVVATSYDVWDQQAKVLPEVILLEPVKGLGNASMASLFMSLQYQ